MPLQTRPPMDNNQARRNSRRSLDDIEDDIEEDTQIEIDRNKSVPQTSRDKKGNSMSPSKRQRLLDKKNEDTERSTKPSKKSSKTKPTKSRSTIEPLLKRVSELAQMLEEVEADNRRDAHDTTELVLSFSTIYTFNERNGGSKRGKGGTATPQVEKDSIVQVIYNKCIRSVEDTKFKALKEEFCGISLEAILITKSGVNGMTKDTGLSVPVKDYQRLMGKYEEICVERLKTLLNNAWSHYRDATRYINPDNKSFGAFYLEQFQWLKTAVVKDLKAYHDTAFPGAPSVSELNAYTEQIVDRFVDPRDVLYHLDHTLSKCLAARGTLPEWRQLEIAEDVKKTFIYQCCATDMVDPGTMLKLRTNPEFRDAYYRDFCSQHHEKVETEIQQAIETETRKYVEKFQGTKKERFDHAFQQLESMAIEQQVDVTWLSSSSYNPNGDHESGGKEPKRHNTNQDVERAYRFNNPTGMANVSLISKVYDSGSNRPIDAGHSKQASVDSTMMSDEETDDLMVGQGMKLTKQVLSMLPGNRDTSGISDNRPNVASEYNTASRLARSAINESVHTTEDGESNAGWWSALRGS